MVYFTGVLRLEKARKEAVILACTMTSEAQATLLEIEVTSNFVLSPIMDPLFSKTPIFLKTVSYCQDEADAWRRQIKVGFMINSPYYTIRFNNLIFIYNNYSYMI